MGYADLHVHSTFSYDGSATVPAVLEQAARVAKLDAVAITDHDEVEGALLALQLAPAYGIHVIPGEEVTTRDGHLLALFIHERVPPKLSFIDTVLKVGEQGGLCVAAHPMALGVHGASALCIYQALQVPEVREIFVGIETLNAGLVISGSNFAAQALCSSLHLASTGGSDAHVCAMIGDGATEFAGSTSDDLRRALMAHTTRGVQRNKHLNADLIFSFVYRRALRKLGWVTWNPEPNAGFVVRRLASVQMPVETGA
jgi:predicted metal-dependent phosphoesterase TrpH